MTSVRNGLEHQKSLFVLKCVFYSYVMLYCVCIVGIVNILICTVIICDICSRDSFVSSHKTCLTTFWPTWRAWICTAIIKSFAQIWSRTAAILFQFGKISRYLKIKYVNFRHELINHQHPMTGQQCLPRYQIDLSGFQLGIPPENAQFLGVPA